MNIDQINAQQEQTKDALWRKFWNDMAKMLAGSLVFIAIVLLLVGSNV